MSRRTELIRAREGAWRDLERLIDRGPRDGADWARLSKDVRGVCADLARARSWGAGDEVVRYLETLSGRAHGVLYGARAAERLDPIGLVLSEAPRELRASGWVAVAAFVLLYAPAVASAVVTTIEPSLAVHVVPQGQLDQAYQQYTSDLGRPDGGDFAMTGFYVYNNVGIALRCFATGALAGLGTVFYLVYNGLMMGTILAYVAAMGAGSNILTFVCGHAAWELTAIGVSGTAGLRLGLAMVLARGAEGPLTRWEAVRREGPALLRLVAGAAFMLAVAALIEGLWSASVVPPPVKWAFGVLQAVIVGLWLTFGGRRR